MHTIREIIVLLILVVLFGFSVWFVGSAFWGLSTKGVDGKKNKDLEKANTYLRWAFWIDVTIIVILTILILVAVIGGIAAAVFFAPEIAVAAETAATYTAASGGKTTKTAKSAVDIILIIGIVIVAILVLANGIFSAIGAYYIQTSGEIGSSDNQKSYTDAVIGAVISFIGVGVIILSWIIIHYIKRSKAKKEKEKALTEQNARVKAILASSVRTRQVV